MALAPLARERFGRLLPVYERVRLRFPLIRCVLDGVQGGVALADDVENPRGGLVVHTVGFAQILGDADAQAAVDAITGDESLKGRYLLFYDPPAEFQRQLESKLNADGRVRTRIQYAFDQQRFELQNGEPPAGVATKLMDAADAKDLSRFGVSVEKFWGSADGFVANSFGVLARCEGIAISVCYAAGLADGVAEIDVATAEESRGRGFAAVAGAAFVREAIHRGVRPNWDCFEVNDASRRLAERLGFVEQVRYPFFSINT